MILALEGISAVGKSSISKIISDEIDLPVFCDPVRHGLFGELNRREMFLLGNQCHITMTELTKLFGSKFNIILDRWFFSSYVYDCWKDPSLEIEYEKLFEIYFKIPSSIYVLTPGADVSFNRMISRNVGPKYTLDELRLLNNRFSEIALKWYCMRGLVTIIDSTNIDVAADLIINHWNSLH